MFEREWTPVRRDVPTGRLVAVLSLVVALTASLSVLLPEPAFGYTKPDDAPLKIRGGWALKVGSAGHKVKAVQRKLGFSASTWELYDSRLEQAVRGVQQRHGLKVTGKVNRATWRAIDPAGKWRMDAFNQRPRTDASSTRRERIDVMIKTAHRYLGSEYVWGGAGSARRGVDCSGLMLQAMYSAGLHPKGVSLRKHQTQSYRTTDAMLSDPGLHKIPVRKAKRGDLVFYESRQTGVVNHVALLIGGHKVIEAVEPKVRIGPRKGRDTVRLHKVAIRPFPKG